MEPGPISALYDFPETQSEATLQRDEIPPLYSPDSSRDEIREEQKESSFNNPINIEDNEDS